VFEGSFRCIENVFEEVMFLGNHHGELVHPMRFLPYSRGALLDFVHSGPTAVPGLASADDFTIYLSQYAFLYDRAERNGIFHSSPKT
jgi:hypothetical protein